jgi:hypothetical protein
VSENLVETDPLKVKGVMDWPTPNTVKELRGFLRFLNFYRRFIKDFSIIARPLHALTGKDQPWIWNEDCKKVFDQLKQSLCFSPSLSMPRDNGQFKVETDGSGISIGAILSQMQDGQWRPIAYISKSLSDMEQNYHATDLELLAIIFALKEWRHYLIDASEQFLLVTDHKNLEFFRAPQDLSQ